MANVWWWYYQWNCSAANEQEPGSTRSVAVVVLTKVAAPPSETNHTVGSYHYCSIAATSRRTAPQQHTAIEMKTSRASSCTEGIVPVHQDTTPTESSLVYRCGAEQKLGEFAFHVNKQIEAKDINVKQPQHHQSSKFRRAGGQNLTRKYDTATTTTNNHDVGSCGPLPLNKSFGAGYAFLSAAAARSASADDISRPAVVLPT
jgi:hypothetical protein